MYTLQEISKPKRKKLVKNIEKHLKNYNNYKVAILNLSKQLEFIASNDNMEIFTESVDDDCEFQESVNKLASELQHIQLVKDSIDISLSELTELEYKFVEYRYFKNWTIEKSALEIGYSDKALFVIRNQVMDKLLISLGSVVYM
ncbi:MULTISPECIES: transcriptional regulator [Bacillus]|uniref:transcriptional regulator n=1 Tax=Bacillus TaxID=1386 RepID=UPI000BAE1D54|nr:MULTISPECIES: transcriptional regulator [Bacillus]MCM3356026.1 transcriptional regulator [Bacillus halotolerans]MEC3640296.1 transcriptional regulator [Bacillus halotolerans]PAY11750.1 transcriptional regulator [Bacillus sp. 7705b]QVN27914.1 transcriptional regulator [Bacillus halotolerans]